MHDAHYVCNRCGSADVELSDGITAEAFDEDDEDDRFPCWCNDCMDYRYADVAED